MTVGGLVVIAFGLSLFALGIVVRRWWALWIPVVVACGLVLYSAIWGCGNPGPGERCDGGGLEFVALVPMLLVVATGLFIGRLLLGPRPADSPD